METEWQATGSMNLGLLANHWSSRTEEGAGCQARLNLGKELEGMKGGGELMLSYQLSTVGTRAKTLGLFQSGALGYTKRVLAKDRSPRQSSRVLA